MIIKQSNPDSSLRKIQSWLKRMPFLVLLLLVIVVVFCWWQIKFHSNSRVQFQAEPLPDFVNQVDHELPVVMIETDPKNLWDEEIGIYVLGKHDNYKQRGQEWQRPATFQFFAYDLEAREHHLALEQEIGLRIHGGGTRSHPQKSLRLYASHEAEEASGETAQGTTINAPAWFNYPFFPSRDYQKFKTLVLRAGGGDWEAAHLRDVLAHRLVAKSNSSLAYQADRPVVLYLNNQYWGLYYLRERQDEEYFRQNYDLDPNKVNLLEIIHDVGERRGQAVLKDGPDQDSVKFYNKLLEQAKSCDHCADFAYYDQYLALENLIDYYIFQIHLANYDWPYGNAGLWRYQTPIFDQQAPVVLDGRYRWLFFDLDVGFGFGSETQAKMIEAAYRGDYGRLLDNDFPFRNLFYDEKFLPAFLNRYAGLLNTALSKESVLSELEQLVAEISPEMPRQIERWRHTPSDQYEVTTVDSMQDWEKEVNLLRTYVQFRPEFMQLNTIRTFEPALRLPKLDSVLIKEKLGQVQTELNYSQIPSKLGLTDSLKLKPAEQFLLDNYLINLELRANLEEAGSIKVHRTSFKTEQLPWQGTYFSHMMLTIKAEPKFGYRFVQWEGEGLTNKFWEKNRQQATIKVPLNQPLKLKAVFAKGVL